MLTQLILLWVNQETNIKMVMIIVVAMTSPMLLRMWSRGASVRLTNISMLVRFGSFSRFQQGIEYNICCSIVLSVCVGGSVHGTSDGDIGRLRRCSFRWHKIFIWHLRALAKNRFSKTGSVHGWSFLCPVILGMRQQVKWEHCWCVISATYTFSRIGMVGQRICRLKVGWDIAQRLLSGFCRFIQRCDICNGKIASIIIITTCISVVDR